MKKTLLILSLLVAVVCANAQSDYGKFAYGFGVAAGSVGNSSFAVGLPFFSQPDNGTYSTSEGVMHAQLIRVDLELAGCQNDPEVSPTHVHDTAGFFLGFDGVPKVHRGDTLMVFEAFYPYTRYDSTAYEAVHYNWDAQFNYDSLTSLVLDVYPIYDLFDTLYLDSTDIVDDYATNVLHIPGAPGLPWHMLHGGPNVYELETETYHCDSIRHFFVNLCGGTVVDADGNPYQSLYVGNAPQKYCWFKSNMKTTKYNSGDHVPNMIYYGEGHTDTTANLAVYGRLYNWYATVNLPDGSTDNPAKTLNGGFVTGICPEGWHVPDSANIMSLNAIDAMDIMSNILWLIPGHDTGAGFFAKPAGLYNYNTGRFENMLGQTYFWSSVRHNYTECWVCSLSFGCNRFLFDDLTAESGVSVRCVKNQMFDTDGNELNN